MVPVKLALAFSIRCLILCEWSLLLSSVFPKYVYISFLISSCSIKSFPGEWSFYYEVRVYFQNMRMYQPSQLVLVPQKVFTFNN